MTIPTTGTFTDATLRTEWGLSLPMTSAQLASAAGLGAAFTSEDLRGKSARSISITIVSSATISTGSGALRRDYTRIIFGVSVSDGATPTSYQWSADTVGTTAQVTFNGPTYNPNGFNIPVNGTAYVSVVIGGQTFTTSRVFEYQQGDAV